MSVEKTHRVVVIEEHMRSGGLGDDVLRAICDLSPFRFLSASIPDTFVHEYGSYESLCESVGLSPDAITQRVLSAI